MDNAGYTALSRQSGLLREMQAVANNIANLSTTGFRREGLVFSEVIHAMENGAASLSMTRANTRDTRLDQGSLSQTNGTFDLAIEGDGFFLIETPSGNALSRAGAFTPNENGELVTPDGFRLLDSGAAPIFVPQDARSISIAADGTLAADGSPLGQIGLFVPADPNELIRRDGVMFTADGDVEPADSGRILQGFLEASNVNSVAEITRMIEVQRAYELGQKLLEQEDERIKSVMRTLSR